MNTTINNVATNDYSLTTFDYVVVEKDKLVTKLRENREGHNAIYEAAVSGYWVKAGETLKEKQTEFEAAIAKATKTFNESFDERSHAVAGKDLNGVGGISAYFSFSQSWPLTFPTNRLEDYDRVIAMLEFSVADKVKLSSSDFDCYVRNNWSWTKSFADTNQGYVQCVSSGMMLSNYLNNFALSGASAITYR